MRLTHLTLKNWRNFYDVDIEITKRLFIVGPNASGKSNLLDALRFLGDIAQRGGGLVKALDDRGGLPTVRNLNTRNHNHGRVLLEVQFEDEADKWFYALELKSEKSGHHRPIVAREEVRKNGKVLLSRPDSEDRADPELLTQTSLEQISANREFRVIGDYLSSISYFHLSPQAIRQPARGAISDDPYGSGFLSEINATQEHTRKAWLSRIQDALSAAVPEFRTLSLEIDSAGQPHLVADYAHWRANPAKQRESEFSDGTLRLIGLLWAVISKSTSAGLLLLEEPEISLNAAVVRILPSLLARAQRGNRMQVAMTTHSPDLLDDEGVNPAEVCVLRVSGEGTTAALLKDIDEAQALLAAEMPISDIVETLIDPRDLNLMLRAVGTA